MRNIDDILNFRSDISPFLVHLTRNIEGGATAKDALRTIVETKELICGKFLSDAKFGMSMRGITLEEQKRLFGAICFTETPLNEVHCLFEIAYRDIELKQYGLVFVKDRLASRGVAPVLYINNEEGDKDPVFQALCSLKNDHIEQAQLLLPLIAVFGKKIQAPGATRSEGSVNFTWEREWRYPSIKGPFGFSAEDVFVGLCPDGEKDQFEGLFQHVRFIDPTRNMKWYATELIQARERLGLKFPVA